MLSSQVQFFCNYDLVKAKDTIELTPVSDRQNMTDIIKVVFTAEQLYWIALDHTGIANKAPLSSLDQLAQNRQADIHHGIYIGHRQLNLSVQSYYNT